MYPAATLDEIRLGKVKPLFSFNTGIDKQPIERCEVNFFGLVGDEQAESFHGGEERAILQYDSNHYPRLKAQFPNSSARFVCGGFGENLVAAGMSEHNICIGDRVRIGTVILEVTQPRQPCFKLNHRFDEPTLSRFSQDHCQTGWFYRVIKPGEIGTGDRIEVIARPHPQWSIAKVQHYLYIETDNKPATEQLANLAPLGQEVKSVFQRRLENNDIEDWNGRLSGNGTWFEMRIVKTINETEQIKRFILSRTDLGPLPDFSAGAHITVQLSNGLTRAYSLCEPLADDCYQIAVSYDPNSRGGSRYLHEQAKVGDCLSVLSPNNGFKMSRDKHHIFVAAGVGITPFIPMIKEAIAFQETFELHYCVDDVANYAFQQQLSPYSDKVSLYSVDKPLNIQKLLDQHTRGTHVYSCGSPSFVQLVREAADHWSDNHVHFEHFSTEQSGNEAFIVTIEQTGQQITVDAETSMLDALRRHGFAVNSGCETGGCGKCRLPYEGEVDHRDSILTKSERQQCMTPCVSRAKGESLVVSINSEQAVHHD